MLSNNKFINILNKLHIYRKHKILISVSGGLDSSVLLDLFFKNNFNIGIAHCNFKLRSKDSYYDSKFIKKLSIKYNIPFYITSYNTYNISKRFKRSIQETARILRYE